MPLMKSDHVRTAIIRWCKNLDKGQAHWWERSDSRLVFSFDVIVRAQILVGMIDYEAEFGLVSFCLYLPLKYLSNRDQALEAVNRVNIGTRFGRFECVADEFQLRYRRTVDLRAERVTLARLDQLVQAGREVAESALPEFAPLAVAAIPA